MSLGAINTVQSGVNQQATAQTQNVMGKDQFLQLLVAQLQNQDPLNPMDSTGFTAQLAQFSSLEQLQNVNSNLSNLSTTQAVLNNVQAANFIGKTVIASGSEFEVRNGHADPIRFDLNDDALVVRIGIYDAAGNYLRTLEGTEMAAGEQALNWDGLDQNGAVVPDGIYNFEVLAVDAQNQAVDVSTLTSGEVTGVNYKNGSPYLLTNSIEIPLSSVLSVTEPVEIEN